MSSIYPKYSAERHVRAEAISRTIVMDFLSQRGFSTYTPNEGKYDIEAEHNGKTYRIEMETKWVWSSSTSDEFEIITKDGKAIYPTTVTFPYRKQHKISNSTGDSADYFIIVNSDGSRLLIASRDSVLNAKRSFGKKSIMPVTGEVRDSDTVEVPIGDLRFYKKVNKKWIKYKPYNW